MHLLKSLYLSLFFGKRFYRLLALVILVFVISYVNPFIFQVAEAALVIFLLLNLLDFGILFLKRNPVSVYRILPERLSNTEENTLHWQLENHYPFRVWLQLIDEFPEAWQIRDFKRSFILEPGEKSVLSHLIRPRERGEFFFGDKILLKF
jgi:uncharacterized protein (DUF58 family)